jgi:hypothetical protein
VLPTYGPLTGSLDRKVKDPYRSRYLRSREPCHFLPALEPLDHLLSIGLGAEKVTSWADVLGDGSVRREKALGVPGGFEPLHPPLPLARGLMRMLRPIVQVAVLTVFHTG